MSQTSHRTNEVRLVHVWSQSERAYNCFPAQILDSADRTLQESCLFFPHSTCFQNGFNTVTDLQNENRWNSKWEETRSFSRRECEDPLLDQLGVDRWQSHW